MREATAHIKIPVALHRRLKLEAIRTNREMREITVAALDSFLPKRIAVLKGRNVPRAQAQQRIASA